MVAGLLRGLDHEDAARFSFLLATPITTGAIKWGDANSAFAQLRRLSGHTLWPSP
jgi:undecaprenyl pyrophosphate phosphatase UppP